MLSDIQRSLSGRVPPSWKVSFSQGGNRLRIQPPNNRAVELVVISRGNVEPRDVGQILGAFVKRPSVLVAPFLSPRSRTLLQASDVNYMDATGNIRIAVDSPAIFIQTEGLEKNPTRIIRPLSSLKGGVSSRIVRNIAATPPPISIRDFATKIRTSASQVSRVAELLEREALVSREKGKIVSVLWADLIRRWTNDYSFLASNDVKMFLAPRGIEAARKLLSTISAPYAVTGTHAAQAQAAASAPPQYLMMYVDSPDEIARQLSLQEVTRGANVLLAVPQDGNVLHDVSKKDGILYTSLTQTVADLLTGPDRLPSEGEFLLTWMEENQDEWRH